MFRVQGSFRAQDSGLWGFGGSGFRGFEFWVWGSGFGVWGIEVWGLGFGLRVWGLGFGVGGFRFGV